MTNERTVRNYFAAREKKDWGSVEAVLAEGVTFTSPYDDHIDRHGYKERIDLDNVVEAVDEALARYQALIDGKPVRNMEYFRFLNGKISEVDVFFGRPQS